jgi:hypothetical protein
VWGAPSGAGVPQGTWGQMLFSRVRSSVDCSHMHALLMFLHHAESSALLSGKSTPESSDKARLGDYGTNPQCTVERTHNQQRPALLPPSRPLWS